MTHFVTAVLVPKQVWAKGVEEVEEYIAKEMAPYCESGAGCAPEYCEFVITHKKRNFRKDAEKILRDKYFKEERKTLKEYKAFFKAGNYVKIFGAWEGGEANVAGDWGYYTNPKSFYDYYRIGGRWNGVIIGKAEDDKDGGFNFGEEFEDLEKNSVPVKDLLKAYTARKTAIEQLVVAKEYIAKLFDEVDIGYAKPFREFFKGQDEEVWQKLYEDISKTIAKQLRTYHHGLFYNEFLIHKIVADGLVYESEDVGWWGMASPKMEYAEWEAIYEKLLGQHSNDMIVSLDCHV